MEQIINYGLSASKKFNLAKDAQIMKITGGISVLFAVFIICSSITLQLDFENDPDKRKYRIGINAALLTIFVLIFIPLMIYFLDSSRNVYRLKM